MKIHYLYYSILFLFIFSCKTENKKEIKTTETLELPIDSVKLIHANQFRSYSYKDFETIEVFDKNKKLQQRYLLYKGKNKPTTNLKYDVALQIPLKRMISRSTKYATFISLLDNVNNLVGFVGSKYVSNQEIRKNIENGKIKEVGNDDGSGVNFEGLVNLEPDAIFTYDASLYGGTSDTQQKMKELGLPMIICNETLESSPLAQAEWIKFFGVLFEKGEQATEIFNNVKSNYDSLKNLTASIKEKNKPTLFFNAWYNETWFMPNGESYVAQFAKDAGAIYLWNDLEGTGASPLAIESVYERAEKADYWFHASDWKNMNQLISSDRRFVSFKSVKNKSVFNHNKRQLKSGGNDYFESGVAFPDKILEDFIKILHPELIENKELYFYENLK
ncbi:ABC-type Fe3+-hydroxamate transport system, periplasmic component [Bernardetia litoralis DSM 6794]|uniref:ABC-type Fe3+-hydroxamate transport system, periplasmic component n=1 Tax=Bernardetia litoralis (strain ATCC 23117 / DSM 6794 / NBRC 15988 / NCIMB 1366 / Fx l1 / Sio-4) TaxID=880071 RepID=I4AGG8_BERLS|nr:ABC transporter substrate-binding protein [Bernardetia litoralis]AFM03053.1 ABC-type Fe3+-hydroxamate transport system, periplasmic component [Bernardetia litoralis DSM 6794]